MASSDSSREQTRISSSPCCTCRLQILWLFDDIWTTEAFGLTFQLTHGATATFGHAGLKSSTVNVTECVCVLSPAAGIFTPQSWPEHQAQGWRCTGSHVLMLHLIKDMDGWGINIVHFVYYDSGTKVSVSVRLAPLFISWSWTVCLTQWKLK